MPPRPNSRIEVDLKLLEDKNVQRLEEFGKQFDLSINRLADSLEKESNNLANEAARRSGQLSPTASTGAVMSAPGPVQWRMAGSPAGGGPGGASGGNYSVGGYGAGGGGSVAPTGGGIGQPSESFEQEYIRAQRRIGEIPVGLRQALGYYAEGGDFVRDPVTGEKVNTSPWRRGAGRVNDFMFQQAAIKANAQLGYNHLQNIYGAIAGPTSLGQQLGASREGGWFGTGLMSPAFRAGFRENLRAGLASDFGFNPNYSMAQAQAARQTTQSFGYSGHMSDVINEQMKQLQIHQQIDPGTVMSMLDPILRYGGWQSTEGLVNTLRAIPEAAKAASFNLKTFTESLQQTSLEIAQQTGMQPGQVASALSSFSAVTGLNPSRAAGLFTSQNLTMAAAMTGKTMTQLVENPTAAPEMAFGMQVFKSMTGMSAEQLLNLRHTDRAAYNRAMDGVYRMYEQNKDIFGGFSPLELINMNVRNRGRTRQHMAVDQAIRNLDPRQAGSINHIQSLLSGYGPHSKNLVSEFHRWREDNLRKYDTSTAAGMAKYRAAARDEALNILGSNQRKQGRRAAVEITLSPDAKKWFDLITKNTGQQDTPGRNAMSSFFRRANHFATNNVGGDIGGAIGGHTGREIGGVVADIGGEGIAESAIRSLF